MAPAMISVRGTGHCDGTLRKQTAMACFLFVPTMLVGKPTLSGYLELGMFDDAALALE